VAKHLVRVVVFALVAGSASSSPREGAVVEAERLAAEAVRLGSEDPSSALARARRALGLTEEFDPTAFVGTGRKGEVVEDEFAAARRAYRRHRAILYAAMGSVLLGQGEALAASRYLSRAVVLDPRPSRALELARAQIALERGREAIATLRSALGAEPVLGREASALIAQAADMARLPSAQAEIDRVRLKTLLGGAVSLLDGPVSLPPGTELSSAPIFRLDDAPVNLIYAAESSCQHCSADLTELHRLVPDHVRVLILPEGDDEDAAVRQVLSIYGYSWPLLLARDLSARLGLEPRSALVVGRGGWSAAVVKAPFERELTDALAVLERTDVQETVPRERWNHRPVDRSPLPLPPGLMDGGLAPGEDEPFPPEFEAAVEAFRAGRYSDALTGFKALEARGDGWLLSPEARLDRALCLAGQGRGGEARRILLRIGDSRFEAAVDETLDHVSR
jgi:tetratricopeptide (TPR) repeat protein